MSQSADSSLDFGEGSAAERGSRRPGGRTRGSEPATYRRGCVWLLIPERARALLSSSGARRAARRQLGGWTGAVPPAPDRRPPCQPPLVFAAAPTNHPGCSFSLPGPERGRPTMSPAGRCTWSPSTARTGVLKFHHHPKCQVNDPGNEKPRAGSSPADRRAATVALSSLYRHVDQDSGDIAKLVVLSTVPPTSKVWAGACSANGTSGGHAELSREATMTAILVILTILRLRSVSTLS